jgi:hypothetical protein
MDYYAKLTTFQIEGNYQCFQKNFIEKFCIPDLSPEQERFILELNGLEFDNYLCQIFEIDLNHIKEITES